MTKHPPSRGVKERADGDRSLARRFLRRADARATVAAVKAMAWEEMQYLFAAGSSTKSRFLQLRMWGIDAGEPHRNALAAGDHILFYLGAPERKFIGRAELASAAHDWTPSEARVYPGDYPGGVSLAQVEEWDPPVPMSTVLSQIDLAEGARADFDAGVVRITTKEYETTLAVAAGRATSMG